MIYTCEFCKALFRTADECREHEQRHKDNKDLWHVVIDPAEDTPEDIVVITPEVRYSGQLGAVCKSDGEYWCYCERAGLRDALRALAHAVLNDYREQIKETERRVTAVMEAVFAALDSTRSIIEQTKEE